MELSESRNRQETREMRAVHVKERVTPITIITPDVICFLFNPSKCDILHATTWLDKFSERIDLAGQTTY